MKKTLLVIALFGFISCNNQRKLLLPEIPSSPVSEVLDVSPAYIFYDESQADSTLLNRKNLISTTNWLVNVDKRLRLEQAIPDIIFLQDKKRNAQMHKNEDAKNYFTCHDLSNKNLGFIEFTDIYYKKKNLKEYLDSISQNMVLIKFDAQNRISTELYDTNTKLTSTIKNQMVDFNMLRPSLKKLQADTAILLFDAKLSFQDYISLKHKVSSDSLNFVHIVNTEFIY